MNALTIKNLSKKYSTGHLALQDINLNVKKGDFFGLLGPNGAGKSTLIGIIASLVNKSSGQVWVFEHNIDTSHTLAKRCIGLVTQEFNFNVFNTVLQILITQAGYYGIPRTQAKPVIEYYLNKLGLWHKRHEMARYLSGGMKRRLMIVRALIHNPRLLILDEPTAGVDVELRHQLWDFLQELNDKGVTIILTTHYLEEAEALCRTLAIIHQGQVVACDDKKSLLSQVKKERLLLTLAKPLKTPPPFEYGQFRLLDDTTLAIQLDNTCRINQIFAALNREDIEVIQIRNEKNPLETLFLDLTQPQ